MSNLPSALKDFYLNEVMRNDVKEYLMSSLKMQALQKLLLKEDATGLADGINGVDKAFSELEILFMPQSEVKEQIQHSR